MKAVTQQGTITWFEIAKVGWPPAEEPASKGWSTWVIVSNGVWLDFSKYYPATKEWLQGERDWEPTHWAFVNLPLSNV